MTNIFTPKQRLDADLGDGMCANLSVFDDGETLALRTEGATPTFHLLLDLKHVAALRDLLAEAPGREGDVRRAARALLLAMESPRTDKATKAWDALRKLVA